MSRVFTIRKGTTLRILVSVFRRTRMKKSYSSEMLPFASQNVPIPHAHSTGEQEIPVSTLI